MNKLHIAICEDNDLELNHLISIIENHGASITYQTFSSGKEFLDTFKRGVFDLLIMDIYLGDITGIEIVSDVRMIDSEICVAFQTSSLEHTRASYRLNALKYLEKPVEKTELLELIDFTLMKKNNAPYLEIVSNRKNMRILLSHIMYLEQKSRKVLIYLANGEIITTNTKLSEIQPMLTSDFLNCHKSYIVNLSYVKNINAELLVFEMTNKSNVYIRRESFSKHKRDFENYLFIKTRG